METVREQEQAFERDQAFRSPPVQTRKPVILIDDAHTFGGTQIALAWMIVVLIAQGQPVICVCTPRTRKVVEAVTGTYEYRHLLRFEKAPSALPLNLFFFPLRIPAYWRLLRRIQKEGATHWWLNLPDIEFGLAPLLVLRVLGHKPASYLHGVTRFAAFYRSASASRRWLSPLRDFCAERAAFRMHRLLIAPSEASRQELEARMHGVHRPATAFLYPPGPPPKTSPHQYPQNKQAESLQLWVVGSLLQGHKNQKSAIDTLALLRSRGVDAFLTVAGSGPDLRELQAHAQAAGVSDFVSWTGWLDDPWSLAPSDAVVLAPSFHETLGLVAREALGHGLRLVVSPIPVFREWVPEEMIARDFSPSSFAEAVLRVKQLDSDAVAATTSRALSRFTPQAFSQKFENLSLLARNL